MDDVNVPSPNPFLADWLRGPTCRAIVYEALELYEALYREVVAKQTGRLARSTHLSTGIERGRWVGTMVVGNDNVHYAASHEFGTGRYNPLTALPAAHDLETVLNMMAAL